MIRFVKRVDLIKDGFNSSQLTVLAQRSDYFKSKTEAHLFSEQDALFALIACKLYDFGFPHRHVNDILNYLHTNWSRLWWLLQKNPRRQHLVIERKADLSGFVAFPCPLESKFGFNNRQIFTLLNLEPLYSRIEALFAKQHIAKAVAKWEE